MRTQINDLDLLLSDPVEWHKKQEEKKENRIYDENVAHRRHIEDVYRDYEKAHDLAYQQLVSAGRIEEGDVAPWFGNRLYEFATEERERMSSVFESFLRSLGMR